MPSREDRIHGYLLVILEILKFAGSEFEQQLEKYLSKYNLYHQQSQQGTNNPYNTENASSSSKGSNVKSSSMNNPKLAFKTYYKKVEGI